MFTGIIEGKGLVAARAHRSKGAILRIKPTFRLHRLKIGESIAVNGCCLTVARKGDSWFEADLSHETLRVTDLGELDVGDCVNLERPVRPVDRLGGHIVQGHIDGVGKILAVEKNGKGSLIKIRLPKKLRSYLIPKGSVAVDGVSMTVNRLGRDQFSLFVIPHTLKVTTLGERQVGDSVNLEVDIIGKYIERLVGSR
ncbi:MAG: riboflavin synthase [Deltaproteobacteria bacterium]|nr:riboflavin synthase [Deltaproteobacteria bacterium]MBI4374507.1 riboflavin synthase [Deltaproteobacteria bacterium]